MSSLTLGQQRALALVPKVSGSLSFVFSLVIIVTILRDGNAKRGKVYHRLVCGMAVADAFSSFALALSTWPIPSTTNILWAVGTVQTCTAQGFFTQFGISSPLYNLSLSFYYILAVKYGWKEGQLRRIEPFFHLFPFTWAIATAVAGLPLEIFNSANLWCWIANAEGRNMNTSPFRWGFFYGPLWMTIAIVTINLLLVFLYVRRVTLRSERYARIMSSGNNVYHETTEDQRSSKPSNERAASMERISFEKVVSSSDDAVYFDQGYSSMNRFSNAGVSSQVDSNPIQAGFGSENDTEQAITSLSDQEREINTDSEIPNSPSINQSNRHGSHRLSSIFFPHQRSERLPSSPSTKATDAVAKATQFARRRRQVANQCLRYSLAFYWTWIPITLVRILQTIENKQPSYALFVLAAMNTPMQGLPNFIVYLYPLVMKARKQATAAVEQNHHPNERGNNQPKGKNNLLAWIRISLSPASYSTSHPNRPSSHPDSAS